MPDDQLSLVKTEAADLSHVADFIRLENGDSQISDVYLNWWYFKNPSGSFSFWQYLNNQSVVGVATTNNFEMQTAAGKKTVAMPQKVLTSAAQRGKGLFGKLYRQTEKDNLENGAEFFLTFTNEASTPIFLGKFGYRRGRCPDVIFILPRVRGFVARRNYEIGNFDAADIPDQTANNTFVKSAAHFRWRYAAGAENDLVTLKVAGANGQTAGFVFLKKIYKKRLPLFVLLDLLVLQTSETERLLGEAVNFASAKLSLGLLALDCAELNPHWQRFLHRRVRNRFNFLCKGLDENHTKELAETDFNFAFGDLDFI